MKLKNIIKALLLTISSLSVMCTGVISPATPIIKKSFLYINDIDSLVKLLVVLPNLFIAIFSPIAGAIISKISKKAVLLLSLIGYGLFGTTGAYMDSIYMILASRACLGVCIAFLATSATALIADYFVDPKERSSVIGMQSTIMCVGSVVYTMLGGFLADMNWRYIFLIYGIAFVLCFLSLVFLVNPKKFNVDTKSESKSENFVLQNNYAIMLICGINMFIMIVFYLIKLQLPFILYIIPGMTAKKIALALCVETAIAALFSLKYKRLKKNRDYAIMCAMAMAVFAVSYVMIGVAKSYAFTLVAMAVCGIALGFLQPNTILWILSLTRPKNRGVVIGFYTTSTYLGKFLSPILLAPLVKYTKVSHSFIVCAFMMLFVSVLSMFLNDYLARVNRFKLKGIIRRAKTQGRI